MTSITVHVFPLNLNCCQVMTVVNGGGGGGALLKNIIYLTKIIVIHRLSTGYTGR